MGEFDSPLLEGFSEEIICRKMNDDGYMIESVDGRRLSFVYRAPNSVRIFRAIRTGNLPKLGRLRTELRNPNQVSNALNARLTYNSTPHFFTILCNYKFNSHPHKDEENPHGVLTLDDEQSGAGRGIILGDLENLIPKLCGEAPEALRLGFAQRAFMSGVTIKRNEGGIDSVGLVERTNALISNLRQLYSH